MDPENGSENAPNYEDVESIMWIAIIRFPFIWMHRTWHFLTI